LADPHPEYMATHRTAPPVMMRYRSVTPTDEQLTGGRRRLVAEPLTN
jgi:hypothetical protein